ncbi:putative transport protein [Salmonella enterica subsp. enterica]|uniref:Putative transport protein n=1 Tax=Salmonella enterica I TaxID=59201 RepID=A0A3S4JF87_SALET|nr:putative transport protein [Salmonella enterica subsp. enterica]
MTQIKHERSTQDLVRAAVSGWLGTALEFMDFQLYSLGAALVFHEIFFPGTVLPRWRLFWQWAPMVQVI